MSTVSPSSKVTFNEKLVQRNCRFCNSSLDHSLVDLGTSPLCQRHVKPEEANDMEPFFPLHAFVCQNCFLVQLDEFVSPDEIFSNDYAYFSSYSTSWLAHAKKYTDKMQEMLSLGKDNLVVELASNDGYLLQYFVEKEVPVLGIEPTANTAEVAIEKGVRTEVKFFGVETAKEMSAKYGKADLLLGNNVLAHVPDINDFVGGMKIMLAEGGVITMEFPHLQRLMEENQFDTIYHEHFSYLSFTTVERIFDHHGLTLFDVEELPTHGGSIRIFGRHKDDESKPLTARAIEMHAREIEMGFQDLGFYADFEERVKETKRKILEFLIEAKREGKQVVGYGAPGKGNTLLNYCGIRTDFIDYTVDRNPHKQGNFLPGTRIPIYDPEKISESKPDYIFILPWNLKTEIINQMSFVRATTNKWFKPNSTS